MRSVQYLAEQGIVRLIDQTRLPGSFQFVDCRSWQEVAQAIREMRVRGAPAIGVAAAYGLALAALRFEGDDPQSFEAEIERAADRLGATRPTAVNLFWALEQLRQAAPRAHTVGVAAVSQQLLDLAEQLADNEVAACRRLG